MKKKGISICIFFISLYFIFMNLSCAMSTISRFSAVNGEVEEIFRTSSEINLTWNNDDPSNVQSFNIYYRSHGASDWLLLDTINDTTPVFEVQFSDVGNGSWDFGVTSVDLGGLESDVHSSLDVNAQPTTGWYLLWIE